MISVFYVLGTAKKTVPEAEFPEMLIGKFFTRKDAEAHAETCRAWKNIRIEEKQETEEQQHPSHIRGRTREWSVEAAKTPAPKRA